MERDLMQSLIEWKSSPTRKPLILDGARQVGKTWLLKSFGQSCYDNVAYVNFDGNPLMDDLFSIDYNTQRLLMGIQAATGEIIDPERTLIIFDEIQECPRALTSLKYFCEERPDLNIASAGSLLGLMLHSGTGFPVGKVDFLELYPMSFREFLDAVGESSLRDLLDSGDPSMIDAFSSRLKPLLRQYYYVGGMPEAVQAFASQGTLSAARAVQEQVLFGYRMDISKHLSTKDVERILEVWDSIPRQLGEENKRFVFGAVKQGKRGRDYKEAIKWLSHAGLAHIVPRVSKPGMPLSAYVDNKNEVFKLFMLDIGLLGAMSGLKEAIVIKEGAIFEEFKGALTEQYVCQELIAACELKPYYWSATNSSGEIDFIVQNERGTYPIEVKAEENLKAKSLRAFAEKHPDTTPLRFSMSGYRKESWMTNVPLYAMMEMSLW